VKEFTKQNETIRCFDLAKMGVVVLGKNIAQMNPLTTLQLNFKRYCLSKKTLRIIIFGLVVLRLKILR